MADEKLSAEKKTSAKQIKQAIIDLKVRKEEQTIAGHKVWVYGLSSYQMEEWRLMRHSDTADARLSSAKLVQMAMRHEDGSCIFEPNELAIIAGRPAEALEPIVNTVMRLSGYGAEAQEEILKNLLRIHGAAGLSALLENINAQLQSSLKDIPDGS